MLFRSLLSAPDANRLGHDAGEIGIHDASVQSSGRAPGHDVYDPDAQFSHSRLRAPSVAWADSPLGIPVYTRPTWTHLSRIFQDFRFVEVDAPTLRKSGSGRMMPCNQAQPISIDNSPPRQWLRDVTIRGDGVGGRPLMKHPNRRKSGRTDRPT